MNIEKNQNTFKYVLNLLIKHSESDLGRKLTNKELQTLIPVIAKKCEKLPKEDIVRKIFELERSHKEEKQHRRLSVVEQYKLKEAIYSFTCCPVKLTSSSDELEKAVNKLLNENIQFDSRPPLSLPDKIKRWTALGLVGATAVGIIGHEVFFKDQNTNTAEETEIAEVTQPKFSTPEEYFESQLEDTTLLTHFKEMVASEFNEKFDYNLSADNFTIELKTHTFIYKLTNEDGKVFYITKGDSPTYVEKFLPQAGYTCERVAANTEGSNVITLSGNGITIACAENENRDLVGIDAFGWDFTNHQPSQEELDSGYSNILNSNSEEHSQLLVDICSTGAFDAVRYNNESWYVKSLLKYLDKHPNSKWAQKVISVIEKHENSKATNINNDSKDDEFVIE